ncbi:DNA-directed primase/polymerase protein [Eucyclogobius newberryi]|uniref:DNA-directed primase/polymerase protein n=1 Tax=Eucyclogobius newberryi TaxID=166745 RepID=UPI003B5C67DA
MWEARVQKVEQLAQSFQKNPLTSGYKPRLWPCQPASVWKIFPRQTLAFHFAKSCKEDVHVFALEKETSAPGQRMFLVTSYTELWHYYRTYPQSLMHCYEVIPEEAVCKLYFDLEFHKPSNIKADGKNMVSLLIQFVCVKLKDTYGIDCSALNVLNLDSSTEDKFSRHLIFNLPNAAFKDNIHVGRFIHNILEPIKTTGSISSLPKDSVQEKDQSTIADKTCEEPQTKRHKPEDLSFLLVKNKDGEDCLFVDLGVYTKNRNFRLYKSSKMGKNAAFTVAEDNSFSPKTEKGVSVEEAIFLASLVCNISFTGQKILTFSQETNPTGRSQRRPAPGKASSLSGCSSSPHQEMDQFVLTLVQKDEIQGSIRRWNYFAADQLLVYDIVHFRWCENVARFHKSNNILIVVDLKEEVWYQKCHDPDCRNFRSSSYPLPQEICISYLIELDEEDQMYLMDDSGNIELSQGRTEQPRPSAEPLGKAPDNWGNTQDDLDYLESLNAFEQNKELPDELLLECMNDYDSQ